MIEPDARVLVCLINRPRDLEIARWDHWVSHPREARPTRLPGPISWRFNLSAPFGDEKWAIHEYAEVRGHELVRRVDLFPSEPDHPRANELYYKMQLGPLQRLSRPIPSLKWRRIAFIQTTGDRFMNALEVSELAEDHTGGDRFVQLMEDDH